MNGIHGLKIINHTVFSQVLFEKRTKGRTSVGKTNRVAMGMVHSVDSTYSSRLKAYKSSHVLRKRSSGVQRQEGSPLIVRVTSPEQENDTVDEPATMGGSHAGRDGPSTDLKVISSRLSQLALPYWKDGPQVKKARMQLAGVVALTLGTTGVSVLFSYLGRDFFNALSAKDQAKFSEMLVKWLIALCLGIPVFVMRDYYQSKLALDWREWMTKRLMEDYFDKRRFYSLQSSAMLDNPDQRITSDVNQFTSTTLSLSMTLLNSLVDLISFSGILFSIYPPLFVALLVYSIGGTIASISIGRPLIGLNFLQEAAEADFRYGLVRVRENAESIAFYGGEEKEESLLWTRIQSVVQNYGSLLVASRRLSFFTSFYRFLIQILPAAVVAPLYFKGDIEFGVVNQSSSAFNHILTDISLIVFQFEALAGFSAVVDRLGELTEVFGSLGGGKEGEMTDMSSPGSQVITRVESPKRLPRLLEIQSLNLCVPKDEGKVLIRGLDLSVDDQTSLLIMGPSGSGKTSLLRAIAGLWHSGNGMIVLYGSPVGRVEGCGETFFVPQRPYMVLGTLRDQLLYPTWASTDTSKQSQHDRNLQRTIDSRPVPTDTEIRQALMTVKLDSLLDRIDGDLDYLADWAAELSLGEQQRIAFARVLLSMPKLVLMDESTSALDAKNERILYTALKQAGITFVSVGHRPTLLEYHDSVLILQGDAVGSWTITKAKDVDLKEAIELMD
jgi:ABC-type uncharacterized transport system fused permease/ATPase subunit